MHCRNCRLVQPRSPKLLLVAPNPFIRLFHFAEQRLLIRSNLGRWRKLGRDYRRSSRRGHYGWCLLHRDYIHNGNRHRGVSQWKRLCVRHGLHCIDAPGQRPHSRQLDRRSPGRSLQPTVEPRLYRPDTGDDGRLGTSSYISRLCLLMQWEKLTTCLFLQLRFFFAMRFLQRISMRTRGHAYGRISPHTR